MAVTFTVPACPVIEGRIASDMRLIRDAVLGTLGRTHIKTLALGGGFGRGEGTAFLADDLPHIVNDYDIRIVHNIPGFVFHAYYRGLLDKLAERYAHRLTIKQIDLSGQYYRDLDQIPAPTIANYELFHGYHVFYGEDLLAPVANHIPVDRIPLWEGTWLLRNRSIGLILAGLYFIDRPLPADDKRENLWIETNKATLAVGDAFLLAQGCYHWSYLERGRRIAGWSAQDKPPWADVYCNAVQLKLNPGSSPYNRLVDELIIEWYRARDIMEQGFRWFEARRTAQQWDSWGKYLDHCVESPIWRQPRFWINCFRAHTASPEMAVRMARVRTQRLRSAGLAARLLFSVHPDGIDDDAIEQVARVVGLQINGTPVVRWRKLAALLLSSIHPSGEAGRVAAEN